MRRTTIIKMTRRPHEGYCLRVNLRRPVPPLTPTSNNFGWFPPTGTVRPIAPAVASKPHAVAPTSFNDAQEMADRFVADQPVIVNLQGVDADLSRRIIDFASGLCYGLGGEMEKVANQVYLMTPTDVEVSADERRRLEQEGP